MISVLLQAGARHLFPVQLAFSLFLLLRGHNLPGGGFIGGLVASASVALWAIAFDVEHARNRTLLAPSKWLGMGLLTAGISGTWPLTRGEPYMESLWTGHIVIPLVGKLSLGTPLLFDIGIYMTVFGATTAIMFSIFRLAGQPAHSRSDK